VKLDDLLRSCLQDLYDRKLRTTLTLSGIVIGAAALASLQSLAEGARASVLDPWQERGALSQFGVAPRGENPWPQRRRTHEMRQRREKPPKREGTAAAAEAAGKARPADPASLAEGEASGEAPARPLDEKALEEIRKIPGVRLVSVPLLRPLTLLAGGDGIETLVYGLPPEIPGGEGIYKLEAGSHFAPGKDVQILIGKRLAGELGFDPPQRAIGTSIKARWEELAGLGGLAGPAAVALQKREMEVKVAGIIDAGAAYITVGPFRAVVNLETAEKIRPASIEALRALASGKNLLHEAVVFLERGVDLQKTEARVREMGFTTRSALEFLSDVQRGMLLLQVLLGCLGGVALSVAGLGIANTFLTAVYERTHEIGVRRAVGARRADIRSQFFFDAAVLGLAGALGGLALAWGTDRYVATAVFRWIAEGERLPEHFYVFSPRLIAGSIAFCILMSVLASLYPASRAARLSPVDSLRHE